MRELPRMRDVRARVNPAIEWLEDQANWPAKNLHGCYLFNFRDDEPDDYDDDSKWSWGRGGANSAGTDDLRNSRDGTSPRPEFVALMDRALEQGAPDRVEPQRNGWAALIPRRSTAA